MRDQVLKSWTFKEGDDIVTGNYGSGYPAGNFLRSKASYGSSPTV